MFPVQPLSRTRARWRWQTQKEKLSERENKGDHKQSVQTPTLQGYNQHDSRWHSIPVFAAFEAPLFPDGLHRLMNLCGSG